MNQEMDCLLDIFKHMLDILDELILLSGRKKDTLIKNDLKELNCIIGLELELTSKLANCEKKRQELTERINEAFGNEKNSKLDDILLKLNDNIKAEFEFCRKELVSKLSQQKKVNDLNTELTNQGLSYIDFMMNLLTGNKSSNMVYNNQGYIQQKMKARTLYENKV